MFSFLVGTAVGAWAMNGYIMNKAYNGQVPWMDQKCWRSTWQGCSLGSTDQTINKVKDVMRQRGITIPEPIIWEKTDSRNVNSERQINQRRDTRFDDRQRRRQ